MGNGIHCAVQRPNEHGRGRRFSLIAASLFICLIGMIPSIQAQPREFTDAEKRELATAQALDEQAFRAMSAGKHQDAISLATRSAVIFDRVLGPDAPGTAASLNNLAGMLMEARDYARAEQLHLRALAIREKALGPDSLATANSLNNLGGLYAQTRAYAKAEPLQARALAIFEKVHGPDHPETVGKLLNLASLYYKMAEYAKAEPLYTRALAIREKSLGPEHPNTANTLDNLALMLDMQGKYAPAEPLYARALAIREKTLGREHPTTASSCNNLGSLYYVTGDYAKAKPLFVRALEIREKALGPDHPSTALSLNQLASLHVIQGEYAQAEPLFVRALAIWKKVNGPDHPSAANSMHHLAGLYRELGEYAKAEPLYLRALAIREEVLGPDHPDSATSLNGLGRLHQARGDLAQAESLFARALAICEKSRGADHPIAARYLTNLALVYRSMGDEAKAEPLYLRALKISENSLGADHASTGSAASNLAGLYRSLGEFEKAEPLYVYALQVAENSLGPNHPAVAAALTNLAGLYDARGEPAKAAPLYLREQAIVERTLGAKHPDMAGSLNNLAYLHWSMGEHAKAEPLYVRALAIREAALGEKHPATAHSLNSLAGLYRSMKEYAKAEPLARRACDITLDHLDNAAFAQSERQQLAMAGSDANKLHFYLSIAVAAQRYEESAYEFLLAWKGSVLTRQRLQRAAADDPLLAEKVAQLQQVATRLSTLALKAPDPQQQEAWQRQIEEYSQTKERLEQELARASAAFGASRRRVTSQQVQAALPADAALVDFVEYVLFEGARDHQRRVAAFVLSKNQPVKLIDLAPVEEVRDAIAAWRGGGLGSTVAAQEAAALLREKFWQPLAPHLKEAKTVLVSPDGEIGKFPLAALPGRQRGTYLIEDYALAIVPAPSALANPLRNAPDAKDSQGLLAVGDVDYDRQAAPPQSLLADSASVRAEAVRGGARLQFTPLQGTGPEVIAVGRAFLTAFPDVRPVRLRGEEATEAAFRAAAPNYRYLHLATHGYFAPASVRSALSRDAHDGEMFQSGLLSDQSLAGYHPGLLSGIALSGANRPAGEGDDGILTASEVQALDLRRVDLVALSACETGLGQTAGGEGLLGLQRAFQAAGAGHVVASLWAVDDAATQTLMTEFYRNLWQEKMGEVEALRRAQLTMLTRYDPRRQELRPRGLTLLTDPSEEKPPARLPPFYWAAFVLSGAGK